jgi:hypothetical protein
MIKKIVVLQQIMLSLSYSYFFSSREFCTYICDLFRSKKVTWGLLEKWKNIGKIQFSKLDFFLRTSKIFAEILMLYFPQPFV